MRTGTASAVGARRHNENDVTMTIAGLWRYGDWRHVATGCTALVSINTRVLRMRQMKISCSLAYTIASLLSSSQKTWQYVVRFRIPVLPVSFGTGIPTLILTLLFTLLTLLTVLILLNSTKHNRSNKTTVSHFDEAHNASTTRPIRHYMQGVDRSLQPCDHRSVLNILDSLLANQIPAKGVVTIVCRIEIRKMAEC